MVLTDFTYDQGIQSTKARNYFSYSYFDPGLIFKFLTSVEFVVRCAIASFSTLKYILQASDSNFWLKTLNAN